MIAVDAADGTLLGLVHATFLRRTGGSRAQRNNRRFEAKESRRWLDATHEAAALADAGASCVTVITDREGDIYEMFACRPAETELLIRVQHDRVLDDDTRLYASTEGLPELGRQTIMLPAAVGRPAREAVLALRAFEVTIRRPHRNLPAEAAKLPPELVLSFVEAREIDPPEGATPAHRRLLTTHAVATLAAAKQITGFYRERWTIEQLFRVMKTKGFDIEAVRIAEDAPFENLVAATLIAAVQVLQMVRERDGVGGRPLEDVFDPADQPALEAVCATSRARPRGRRTRIPRDRSPTLPGSARDLAAGPATTANPARS